MTEREMFEASFQRPANFFSLSDRKRWQIDSDLGILDWQGLGLSDEDHARFDAHYSVANQKATA